MSVRALTCDEHGFGSKKEKCVVCDNWPTRNPALLCNNCSFGSKREACCVCSKWPGKNPAMVCDDHKGKCVKCGTFV